MAKIIIAGDAVVVKSSLKFEELKRIAKYSPESLVLKGGEDNKEDVFRIGVTEGEGRIGTYAAEFNSSSRGEDGLADEDGFATLTMKFAVSPDENIKEVIADKLGTPMIYLARLEDKLPHVLERLNRERENLINGMTVMG